MLTKEAIMRSLARLGEELDRIGLRGEILLTGGAAMCLVHSARDMTKDIDALYEPKEEVNRLAKQIAEEEGLPENWLNDSVKGFLTPGAPIEPFLALTGLTISVVAPDYLLAMKLMSARFGETDAGDIRFLIDKLQIKTTEDALAILTSYFPANQILPKAMYILQEYMDEHSESGREESN